MITSHIAVLGGCAVLLALGFDPFIQNLIDYSAVSSRTVRRIRHELPLSP